MKAHKLSASVQSSTFPPFYTHGGNGNSTAKWDIRKSKHNHQENKSILWFCRLVNRYNTTVLVSTLSVSKLKWLYLDCYDFFMNEDHRLSEIKCPVSPCPFLGMVCNHFREGGKMTELSCDLNTVK